MKLASMKMSKKESKKSEAPISYDAPEYPYGLEINLNKDALDKLGIKVDNIGINSKCSIEAKGKITSVSKNVNERRENASVTIQITDMAVHSYSKNPKTLKEAMSKVIESM